MVYGWVVVLKVVDAELHKPQGLCLALWWCICFCKPQQGWQQSAGHTPSHHWLLVIHFRVALILGFANCSQALARNNAGRPTQAPAEGFRKKIGSSRRQHVCQQAHAAQHMCTLSAGQPV